MTKLRLFFAEVALFALLLYIGITNLDAPVFSAMAALACGGCAYLATANILAWRRERALR